MNLRPIKDQVIVRPDPPMAMMGSIHVPETVMRDNPNYFPMSSTVMAVGPGRIDEDGARVPPDVLVGDRVVHNRYAGNQITCMDDSLVYLVMREADIVAKTEGERFTVLPGYQRAQHEGVRSYDRDPFA